MKLRRNVRYEAIGTAHIGTLLAEAIRDPARVRQALGVWPAWEEAVGPDIASATQPVSLRGGVELRDAHGATVKLHGGFVTGARKLPTRRALFWGCLDMARELNIHSVAEGVEDRDDWEFVRASGCDQAQGYFISRPVPAAELSAWHARWRQRCGELIG